MDKKSNRELCFFAVLAGCFMTSTLVIGTMFNALDEARVEKQERRIREQKNVVLAKPQRHSKWVGYAFGAAITCLCVASSLSARDY